MQAERRTIAWLGHAAITALAAGTLWLPPQSAAHADEQLAGQRLQPPPIALNAWVGTSFQTRCSWPYRNQFPPCMSTWPEGDPNYHGSRTGPTFTR
jgi:hypothetical protein